MSEVFGPYTPVRRAGNMYYIAGQVGVDMSTKTAPAGITEQTRQALKNLSNVLASASLEMDDVVKTTLFLADINDYDAVNVVYETFFEPPRPARSTLAVKSLPKVGGDTTLLIEIEAVAYKESR